MLKFAPVKMEDNQKFLEKATQLFIENGAKTLTMDDVAKEFGMSKKTLYQLYRNKEALLEAVLKFKLNEIISHLRELDIEVENAIERMLCRDEEIETAIESNKSLLLKQIIKYYPAIFARHMKEFSGKFSEVLVFNIKKGREQGIYREDFDPEIYAKLFFQMVMSYESSPFIDIENTTKQDYFRSAMDFYLNAVTNEKGKQLLKNLQKI